MAQPLEIQPIRLEVVAQPLEIQPIRLEAVEPRLETPQTLLGEAEPQPGIRRIRKLAYPVAFLISSSVLRNSRALRQLETLTSAGLDCRVFSIDDKTADRGSVEFDVQASTIRPGRGPRYFQAIHRALSSSVADYNPGRPSVVHASDLYSLPSARTLARRIGAALTYDARELYPHVAATAGRPWATWFWRTLESKLVRSCDAIFTVSDSIADHIAAQYGIPRPTVVQNIPARKVVARSNLLHSFLGIRNEAPVVLHQGHIKRDRGCEILVRAASEVPDAHFLFLGDGPIRPHLQALSASLCIQSRVHFLNPVEPGRLLDYSAAATIGVTLLEDTCLNHRLALPNKLFEYLMAGTPVLASDLPEIRRVIMEFQVGRLARPGSVSDTATQLRLMLATPTELETYAENTRSVFETISWEKASERFLNVFSGLLVSRT